MPSISATLVDADQAPVNLTGTTLYFIMAATPSLTIKVNSPAVLVNAAQGQVRYDWASGDTSTAGDFLVEWQVTFPDGRQQTFPSTGYNTVKIVADLDNS